MKLLILLHHSNRSSFLSHKFQLTIRQIFITLRFQLFGRRMVLKHIKFELFYTFFLIILNQNNDVRMPFEFSLKVD